MDKWKRTKKMNERKGEPTNKQGNKYNNPVVWINKSRTTLSTYHFLKLLRQSWKLWKAANRQVLCLLCYNFALIWQFFTKQERHVWQVSGNMSHDPDIFRDSSPSEISSYWFTKLENWNLEEPPVFIFLYLIISCIWIDMFILPWFRNEREFSLDATF